VSTQPTSNWRDLIKVHPAAEMFPTMSSDELNVLRGHQGEWADIPGHNMAR
jgi:hypothetical protein